MHSWTLTAAAVILKRFYNIDLNDSKKLSPKKRLELKIIEENALAYSVAFINSSELIKLMSVFKI